MKTAAGILLYRCFKVPERTDLRSRSVSRRAVSHKVEILLLHHGGPYWAKKDAGAWTFPKGLIEPGEDAAAAARREFAEETGGTVAGPLIDLGEAKMKGGKLNRIFAAEGDFDVTALRSNTFRAQWPPRSGQYQDFPEIDRALWADVDTARTKLNAALVVFVDRLLAHLEGAKA